MQTFIAALLGLLFGFGILIAGMGDPAKVLGFFDFAGNWDPSLAFVMGGALVVTAIGYSLVLGWRCPLLGARFNIPVTTKIEPQLLVGSAVFGVGWGLSGFCPGGLIPVLGIGGTKPLLFLAGLVAGLIGTRVFRARMHNRKQLPMRA